MTNAHAFPHPPTPLWRRPWVRSTVGALLVGGLCCGVLASTLPSGSRTTRNPSSLTTNTAPLANRPDIWMISAGALGRLDQGGLPANLLASFFDQSTTILVGASGPGSDRFASQAIAAADFTSAAALVQALEEHRVSASVPDVVLDLEAWPLTPVTEQDNPIAAAGQAFRAAQAAGKRLVFTPGVDLVRVLTGQRLQGPALTAAYDQLLAGPGAAVSDVFEVQAQSTEGTSAIPNFVTSAVAAARSSHPGIPVLVGLSTNPSGRRVTPTDLLQLDQASTRAGAAGFWLNVPEAGQACPRCGTAQPQVAVAFLEQLARLARPGPVRPGPVRPGPVRPATPVAVSTTASSPTALLDSRGQLLAAGGRPADWILAASQFAAVVDQPDVPKLMGGGSIYEPVSPQQQPSTLLPVTPTLVVHSETLLTQLVADHQVPSNIRAVLYDNERFADTPLTEQHEPLAFDGQVAQLATTEQWTSICDLVQPDRLFAGQRTPAQEVPPCTVIGLNTVQQSERQPAIYAALVAKAVATIRAIHAKAIVLAGLSANPRGEPVTATELAEDIRATHGLVQGYWLNVPAPGVGCPACGLPNPGLMADALEQLAH